MHRGASAGALVVAVCVVGWFGGTPGPTHAPSAVDTAGASAALGAHGGPRSPAARPAAPGGSVGSFQITIHNTEENSTGTYQQPVAVNSSKFASLLNANWSNAVVYYTLNESPIYGWIESGASNSSTDTLLWLRLYSIPADGWTNVTIYCWPKTSFNLSEDGYMGEAPELSTPYASLDNGWQVFDAYDNFSGTSLGAGWTSLGSWSGHVHDGLRVTASTGTGAIEASLSSPYPDNLTVEADGWMNASEGSLGLFLAGTPGFSAQYQLFPNAYVLDAGEGGSQGGALVASNSTGAWKTVATSSASPLDFTQAYHVVGLSWRQFNATESGSVNYIRFLTEVNTTTAPMTAIGLAGYCSTNCTNWDITWVRARDGPAVTPAVTDQGFSPLGVGVVSSPLATDVSHLVTLTCTVAGGTSPDSYAWSFGDGHTDTGRTVSHAYALPGSYDAACTVTDAKGSIGNSSAEIAVNANPAVLLFQALPPNLYLGSSVNLVTNVSGGTMPLSYTYLGLPPGCPTSDRPTLSCLPGEAGTFAVEILVTDGVGQQTSALVTITVAPPIPPSNSTPLSPAEGYAIAGAVAGVVVLAGVLPVLLWTGRRRSQEPSRSPEVSEPVEEPNDEP